MKRPINLYEAVVVDKKGYVRQLGPVRAESRSDAADLMHCLESEVRCTLKNVRKFREEVAAQHARGRLPSQLRPRLIRQGTEFGRGR